MTSQLRNIGALVSVLGASANASITAAGAGDDTDIVGLILDRAEKGYPQSCVLAVPFEATLAEGETLSLTCSLQSGSSDDLSDATDLHTVDKTVVAVGPVGGGVVSGTFEIAAPIMGAGRYLRAVITPDLSAGAADTAALSSVIVFGGADRLPA
ncbi:hypothetical protein VXL47_12205 [Phaeobacter sp. JH20_30]|uniref:hypothetical protein n=1 Tax=unclassified Phaeobacter TaxID=2621772 RepID=UPI003A83C996